MDLGWGGPKRWTRTLARLVFWAAALVFFPLCGQAPGQDRPAAIDVVLDDNYPPYIFRDPDGAIQGVLVDQWRLWEKATGVRVRLSAMDWARAQQTMREGRADVIDTIFETPERARLYDFSRPYATIEVPVFFHKSLGGITDLRSLRGFTVGVKAGDACIGVLKAGGITSLREYDSYESVINAAADGQILVFSIDKPPALYYLYKLNLEDRFRQSFTLYTGEFHRAVAKGRADLLRMVEEGFAAIPGEELAAVDGKWLGAPLVRPEMLWYALASLAAVSLVILLLLSFNSALRRKVREKTREQRELLEALAKSEEKYRTLVENLNVGVYRSPPDPDGHFIQVNPALARMLGFASPEALMAVPVVDLYEDSEQRIRLKGKVQEQGGLREERVRFRRRDGSPVPVSISCQATFDGEGRLLWTDGIIEDITERVAAEGEIARLLAESDRVRSLLQTVIDTSPDWIFAKDADYRWVLANAGVAKSMNRSPKDFIGRNDLELGWPEEQVFGDASRGIRGFRFDDATVLSGRTIHNPYDPATDAQGRVHVFDTIKQPLRDESGKVIGVLGYARDITARTEVERTLKDLSERYRLAKEAAESANRAKSEFLANMSHEIRTPINGLMGMLQLLRVSELGGEQREHLDAALVAGRSLVRLLSDILDLSRIEAGKVDIVAAPFNPLALMDALSGLFRLQAEGKGLALDFLLDPSVPTVLVGDEARLKQVLFNLVGNAVKFTPEGFVRVEGRAEPAGADGDLTLACTVSDSGIGIDAAEQEAIFEPFTQLEGTYTKHFQGAGLGLAIVKRLVGLMGGEVQVESAPGAGTRIRFTVRVRRAEDAPFAMAAPVREGDAGLDRPLRILLVEDERINLLAGRRLLESEGHEVRCAVNGREALDFLAREAFDLVIMDVQMPVLDGLSATRSIRDGSAGALAPDIPIVAMTAYAMKGDREAFTAAGMNAYVAKPFDIEELRQAMAEAMAGRG